MTLQMLSVSLHEVQPLMLNNTSGDKGDRKGLKNMREETSTPEARLKCSIFFTPVLRPLVPLQARDFSNSNSIFHKHNPELASNQPAQIPIAD